MPVRSSPPNDSRIDVGRALELRWHGLSWNDIADKFGVTVQGVQKRLALFRSIVEDPTLPNVFDTQALGLLKSVHLQTVVALQRKLYDKKSTVNNLAFAGRQLFEQIRLLEGKSTSNISTLTKVIMEAHKAEIEPIQTPFDGSKNELQAEQEKTHVSASSLGPSVGLEGPSEDDEAPDGA